MLFPLVPAHCTNAYIFVAKVHKSYSLICHKFCTYSLIGWRPQEIHTLVFRSISTTTIFDLFHITILGNASRRSLYGMIWHCYTIELCMRNKYLWLNRLRYFLCSWSVKKFIWSHAYYACRLRVINANYYTDIL